MPVTISRCTANASSLMSSDRGNFQVRKSDGAAAGMLVVRSKSVVWMLSVIGRPELTRHLAVAELSKYGAKIAARVNAR